MSNWPPLPDPAIRLNKAQKDAYVTASEIVDVAGINPLNTSDIGYVQRRPDDCLRAAVATALQVPIEQVPDPHIDARLKAGQDHNLIGLSMVGTLEAWAAKRGLKIIASRGVPLEHRRWIGVIPAGTRAFSDHCLVMAEDQLLFDPSAAAICPPGTTIRAWSPEKIEFGVAFEPI